MFDPSIFEFRKIASPEETAAGADPGVIDIAILDMNHGWPNLGHDSIVRILATMAERLGELLREAGLVVRATSYDVRQGLAVPPIDNHDIFIGTGGPGHLDPRENDGDAPGAQGIHENPAWEKPLFELFDAILADRRKSLFAVCHSFGILCRWGGIADAVLRSEEKGGKSFGLVENVLTTEGKEHPLLSRFAELLPDGSHHRVIDNRLYDLIPRVERAASPAPGETEEGSRSAETLHELDRSHLHFTPLGFESLRDRSRGEALTMIEVARDRNGILPRIIGVNHHPEIIDRHNIIGVLDEKLARGEVSEEWYRERIETLRDQMTDEYDFFLRLTSTFTFLMPIEYQLHRIVRERRAALGLEPLPDEEDLLDATETPVMRELARA